MYYPTTAIGTGAYGVVKSAYNDNGDFFAIKQFTSDTNGDLAIGTLREISIASTLKGCHPNILSIHDVVDTNGELSMVMPRLNCKFPYLIECNYLTPKEKLIIAFDLLDAVAFMHENSIIHRDIKTSNILLNHDMSPVLADFSLSKIFTYDLKSNLKSKGKGKKIFPHTEEVTTCTHRAPEIVKGKGYGMRSDIWSLGVVLLEMFTETLVPNLDDVDAIRFVLESLRTMPFSEISVLLANLLVENPGDRITCENAMKRPIFENFQRATSCKPIPWVFKPVDKMSKKYQKLSGVSKNYCDFFAKKMFSLECPDFQKEIDNEDEYIDIEMHMFRSLEWNLYK